MKIVIILPTYNESENIGQMLSALEVQFAQSPHQWEVLVVDDASPDGTGEIVARYMQDHPHIHLLSGTKEGLGAAYIRGMGYALEHLAPDVIMEMDADFSHNPKYLPILIDAVAHGNDFVIGSRFVDQGSIPDDWGILRRMISKWGNIFARYIGGLMRVRDCTSGFRAIRADLLRRISLADLKVKGYAFQVALLHQALLQDAKVTEVPIEFVDRVKGNTKLGLFDVFEFMLNAWWIRLSNSRTFIRFCLVGLSGMCLNLLLFSLFLTIGVNRFVGSALAIVTSILSNRLLNQAWTFRSDQSRQGLQARPRVMNLVSLISFGASFGTFVALSLLLPHFHPLILQALAILPAVAVNYFWNAYWAPKSLKANSQRFKD